MMYSGDNSYTSGWTLAGINKCIRQAKQIGYKPSEIFVTFQCQSIAALSSTSPNYEIIAFLKQSKASGYAGLLGWGSYTASDNVAAAIALFT